MARLLNEEEKLMRYSTKQSETGSFHARSAIQDMLDNVRRTFVQGCVRYMPRSLRDMDAWSDQAAVAFVEERCARRA